MKEQSIFFSHAVVWFFNRWYSLFENYLGNQTVYIRNRFKALSTSEIQVITPVLSNNTVITHLNLSHKDFLDLKPHIKMKNVLKTYHYHTSRGIQDVDNRCSVSWSNFHCCMSPTKKNVNTSLSVSY